MAKRLGPSPRGEHLVEVLRQQYRAIWKNLRTFRSLAASLYMCLETPYLSLERCDAMTDINNVDELRTWLEDGYASSVRTAYLILGDRLDAEDAVQEAFLRAWRFRESLTTATSFKPWLYRVVVNTCNSKLRKEIPHRDRRSRDEVLEDVAERSDPFSRIALSQDVMRALRALPAHLRVVVVLRYYSDLSEREIANVIDRQPGTVKSRLNEARRQLANHPALRTNSSSYTKSARESDT